MTAFVVRRLAWSVPTLLGVALVTFALLHLAPGGPEYALGGEKATAAQLALIRHSLGLDRSLPEQCWLWLVQLLHGNLGFSYARHQTVASLIAQRLPNINNASRSLRAQRSNLDRGAHYHRDCFVACGSSQ